MNVICPSGVPCTGITISDFEIWTDSGTSVLWKCENAFGSGGCLGSRIGKAAFTSTVTVKAAAPASALLGKS